MTRAWTAGGSGTLKSNMAECSAVLWPVNSRRSDLTRRVCPWRGTAHSRFRATGRRPTIEEQSRNNRGTIEEQSSTNRDDPQGIWPVSSRQGHVSWLRSMDHSRALDWSPGDPPDPAFTAEPDIDSGSLRFTAYLE